MQFSKLLPFLFLASSVIALSDIPEHGIQDANTGAGVAAASLEVSKRQNNSLNPTQSHPVPPNVALTPKKSYPGKVREPLHGDPVPIYQGTEPEKDPLDGSILANPPSQGISDPDTISPDHMQPLSIPTDPDARKVEGLKKRQEIPPSGESSPKSTIRIVDESKTLNLPPPRLNLKGWINKIVSTIANAKWEKPTNGDANELPLVKARSYKDVPEVDGDSFVGKWSSAGHHDPTEVRLREEGGSWWYSKPHESKPHESKLIKEESHGGDSYGGDEPAGKKVRRKVPEPEVPKVQGDHIVSKWKVAGGGDPDGFRLGRGSGDPTDDDPLEDKHPKDESGSENPPKKQSGDGEPTDHNARRGVTSASSTSENVAKRHMKDLGEILEAAEKRESSGLNIVQTDYSDLETRGRAFFTPFRIMRLLGIPSERLAREIIKSLFDLSDSDSEMGDRKTRRHKRGWPDNLGNWRDIKNVFRQGLPIDQTPPTVQLIVAHLFGLKQLKDAPVKEKRDSEESANFSEPKVGFMKRGYSYYPPSKRGIIAHLFGLRLMQKMKRDIDLEVPTTLSKLKKRGSLEDLLSHTLNRLRDPYVPPDGSPVKIKSREPHHLDNTNGPNNIIRLDPKWKHEVKKAGQKRSLTRHTETIPSPKLNRRSDIFASSPQWLQDMLILLQPLKIK
ncbi:hypothetical protein ABW20_dc0108223 [Dactylellina cionopaga]|nr:hypothetical protein ABW20_dc0108223 [Dactylellina cionopaga]